MGRYDKYRVVGWQRRLDVPLEEYQDFKGYENTRENLEADLKAGVLPRGLLFQKNFPEEEHPTLVVVKGSKTPLKMVQVYQEIRIR
jgi:hypothetical protein